MRRFIQSVSEQAVGVGVTRGVKPDQQLVKVSVQLTLFCAEIMQANSVTWP